VGEGLEEEEEEEVEPGRSISSLTLIASSRVECENNKGQSQQTLPFDK
jgi:hypothetical protein